MSRPCIHLIANAHIDPVWQWRWEEGCAEALATFRTAVELLDAHPEFIFNHNEALLYRWVRELDPPLFEEIRRLVRAGRWHIAGGWHLQPDVNLPGAESIIRQIAEGRRFFREEFGAAPCVAYNFDSFGHSAGLPQILAAAGYAMYIHMRPQAPELDLPADLYRWEGADGTTILGLRSPWACITPSTTTSRRASRRAPPWRSASAATCRSSGAVSYTHLRAHETVLDLVCRLLLEKKKKQ